MIVLLAILAATRASPLGQTSPPHASLRQFQARAPSCDDPHGCRSLWDIIWSCAVTILLCTWVSVHPNIPSPDERWPRVTLRRVGLMLAALFVPEVMIGWALRQRQAAVDLAERHKGEGWTITHGFFATMGGFMEYEGNRPIRVLLPGQLDGYSLTGNGDFPRIAKEEIEDKSKGDAISKSLVILQTGWFVTQCIARGTKGLPITELELVTVALAALNFVMYLLWWDKPLNVQRGVRAYKRRSAGESVDDGRVEATSSDGFWGVIREALSELSAAIVRGPSTGVEGGGVPWLLRVLVWPIQAPTSIFVGDSVRYEKRVGTFYPNEWLAGRMPFAVSIFTAVSLAFGGIHCIGWSFTFPTSAEQILWRVASVSMTVAPILYMSLGLAIRFWNFGFWFKFMSHVTPIFLYMLSRLALLVLPFLGLRSLPPAAYHVLHWTSHIPHI
ncbi:hypothetical protein F5148DRAFT_862447 [Russula earlei]|uniref:Uncharacterized protein n=1 Tax=Russula earlei TaxID=71964 RepID=A0ACC0TSA0_9AGAM|nr:hypothetical protein F5148DRAFT_862447 [Russula earlei]